MLKTPTPELRFCDFAALYPTLGVPAVGPPRRPSNLGFPPPVPPSPDVAGVAGYRPPLLPPALPLFTHPAVSGCRIVTSGSCDSRQDQYILGSRCCRTCGCSRVSRIQPCVVEASACCASKGSHNVLRSRTSAHFAVSFVGWLPC